MEKRKRGRPKKNPKPEILPEKPQTTILGSEGAPKDKKTEQEKKLADLDNKFKAVEEQARADEAAAAAAPGPAIETAGPAAPAGQPSPLPAFEATGVFSIFIFLAFDILLTKYNKARLSPEQVAKLMPLYNAVEKKWGVKAIPAEWLPEYMAASTTLAEVGLNFFTTNTKPADPRKEPEKSADPQEQIQKQPDPAKPAGPAIVAVRPAASGHQAAGF